MCPDPEHVLIESVTNGDAAAFSEVYNLYKDKVFAFAYTLTKSRDVAEEVVQEVFIKLWERREQINAQASFLPYVKRITYNQVIDFFRKVKSDRDLQIKILERVELLKNRGEELVLSRELERIYQKAIDQLPPQQKTAYLLSRREDLSYEEIAKELGISRNTVRNHLTEAVKNIRLFVARHTDLAVIVIAICFYREGNMD